MKRVICEKTPIKRNNLITTLGQIEKEYRLIIEFKLLGVKNGLQNIIHFTTDGNSRSYGDRIPALYFDSDNNQLIIVSAINHCANFVVKAKYIGVDFVHRIEISQELIGNKYFYSVVVNDEKISRVMNHNPRIFYNVHVFVSDPWFGSQTGYINELTYVSRSCQEFLKPKGLMDSIVHEPVFPNKHMGYIKPLFPYEPMDYIAELLNKQKGSVAEPELLNKQKGSVAEPELLNKQKGSVAEPELLNKQKGSVAEPELLNEQKGNAAESVCPNEQKCFVVVPVVRKVYDDVSSDKSDKSGKSEKNKKLRKAIERFWKIHYKNADDSIFIPTDLILRHFIVLNPQINIDCRLFLSLSAAVVKQQNLRRSRRDTTHGFIVTPSTRKCKKFHKWPRKKEDELLSSESGQVKVIPGSSRRPSAERNTDSVPSTGITCVSEKDGNNTTVNQKPKTLSRATRKKVSSFVKGNYVEDRNAKTSVDSLYYYCCLKLGKPFPKHKDIFLKYVLCSDIVSCYDDVDGTSKDLNQKVRKWFCYARPSSSDSIHFHQEIWPVVEQMISNVVLAAENEHKTLTSCA